MTLTLLPSLRSTLLIVTYTDAVLFPGKGLVVHVQCEFNGYWSGYKGLVKFLMVLVLTRSAEQSEISYGKL